MAQQGLGAAPLGGAVAFSYEEAFSRNLGLVTEDEMQRLRRARVVIAGAGGAGGIHALTLARQGFARFRIADPDTFSLVNHNRQAGAFVSTVGQNKAEVVARMVRDINPEAEVDVWPKAITRENVDAFVADADVVVDGLDVFVPDVRRLLFARARAAGKWVLTSGPLGYSSIFLAFSPTGMSFDEYLGVDDATDYAEKLIAFVVGIAPRGLHVGYTDMSRVDVAKGIGPSAALACNTCASLVAVEAMSLVLGRRPPPAAPAYFQVDLYRRRMASGRVWFGGRNPLQRLKRWLVRRQFDKLGVSATVPAEPPRLNA
jgi:hypothetical protein